MEGGKHRCQQKILSVSRNSKCYLRAVAVAVAVAWLGLLGQGEFVMPNGSFKHQNCLKSKKNWSALDIIYAADRALSTGTSALTDADKSF